MALAYLALASAIDLALTRTKAPYLVNAPADQRQRRAYHLMNLSISKQGTAIIKVTFSFSRYVRFTLIILTSTLPCYCFGA